MPQEHMTRRDMIKRAAYITPIILTMGANFSFASAGSGDSLNTKNDDKKDKKGQKAPFLDMMMTNKTKSK